MSDTRHCPPIGSRWWTRPRRSRPTHPSTLQQHRAPMVRPRRAPTRNQIGWNRCSSKGEIVIAGALTGETGVRASSQAERRGERAAGIETQVWPLLAGTSTALDSQRRPSSMQNPSKSPYMNGKVGRRSREQGRDERAAAGPLIGALESSADSLLAIRAMKKSGWNPTTRQGGKSRNPA